MKTILLLITILCSSTIYAQSSKVEISNKNLINIVNDFYDLTINNEVEETWYLYKIPGGKWMKVQKGKNEIWLPSHQLIKIEINESQITKTIFENGKKEKSVLSLSFRDSLVALNIHKLPTLFTNPLIKIGCSSELSILIKCTNTIEFYELPICPLLIEFENRDNVESQKLEAIHIIYIYDFFRTLISNGV